MEKARLDQSLGDEETVDLAGHILTKHAPFDTVKQGLLRPYMVDYQEMFNFPKLTFLDISFLYDNNAEIDRLLKEGQGIVFYSKEEIDVERLQTVLLRRSILTHYSPQLYFIWMPTSKEKFIPPYATLAHQKGVDFSPKGMIKDELFDTIPIRNMIAFNQ